MSSSHTDEKADAFLACFEDFKDFENFAKKEGKAYFSPIYAHLAREIIKDPEVGAIATYARPGQPRPNLFFAAVHYLLLRGVQHPLAHFYPSLVSSPRPLEEIYPVFRAFCLEQRERLSQLIAQRLVQTNEVSRSACLLPAFGLVAQHERRYPLALIEIGASTGLNLLWDHYGYRYGEGLHRGSFISPVQLECTLRGKKHPPLPAELPTIALRMGIDLKPVDMQDPAETLWLRALIWPEHRERVERLERALEIARCQKPLLMAGDALDLLPEIIASTPLDTTLCLFHSFTMNQFTEEERQQLSAILSEASMRRPIYRIAFEELTSDGYPQLSLYFYHSQMETHRTLAHCSSHGDWLEWVAQ
jgi:hypothetical protein